MKLSFSKFGLLTAAILAFSTQSPAADAANPFVGRWALTIPGGGAGWLGVTDDGFLDASLLWGGGSVVPVDSVFVNDDALCVMRINEVKRKDAAGKVTRTQRFPDLIVAKINGEELELTRLVPRENGSGLRKEQFSGKRIPALPPKPDLATVKFAPAITLFNGKNLEGWKLTSPGQASGWVVENGTLINRVEQERGRPRKSYGNLRTEQEFTDFNLNLETRLSPNGNSGVYLRGIYEVQVADTYGRKLDSHNMGGVYSRITPTAAAEKPAGQWQKLDITLLDRHVTVILNGTKIIDNQPLLGCTGGALWSDEFRPGPIYLQGDHTAIEYRNIVLRPVAK